ncbi:MAG TPA: LEA type 2 family protein [Cytophagaceae bacterium]|jgi:LEA14-like dessication related protein|nr:LEA type 2 family protein [Cytophagaceae bacterium]
MKKFIQIVVLFLCYSLSSCLSFKELEPGEIKNIKVKKISGGGLEIEAGIQVKNPNNYNIVIKEIKADVLVNGKKIGEIDLTKKVVLPKKSESVNNFVVDTQLSNLMSAVPSLLFGGSVSLQLQGYLKGKAFVFSREYPISIEKNISARDLNIF